jgi:glutaminyl-tRNA synthetase
MVPFGREIFIEKEDFMIDPPKKFFRLGPGREVRLKGAYVISCDSFETGPDGEISAVYCSYLPDTKSGTGQNQPKVKGTLHWVEANASIAAEVRLYDRLFSDEDPSGHKDVEFKEFINNESLKVLSNCRLEPMLKQVKAGERFQFTRLGYFCVDPDSTENLPVFNRTVSLKDTWAKEQHK